MAKAISRWARGDIILEINKQQVNGEEEFARIEATMKSGQDVVFNWRAVRPRPPSTTSTATLLAADIRRRVS